MSRDFAIAAIEESIAQRAKDPLRGIMMTKAQREFVFWDVTHGLWIDGNKIGKTVGAAIWTCMMADRRLPLASRFPRFRPLGVGIMGYSLAQMDTYLHWVWEFLPKDRIDPKVRYIPKEGFVGHKEPHVKLYTDSTLTTLQAVISIFTYERGPQALAGPLLDVVSLDEPPPEDVYGEAVGRLAMGGVLRVNFTPTPKSPPIAYLKEKADKGKLATITFGVSEETCTLQGGLIDVPFRRKAEIEEWIGNLLGHEVGMRTRGDWFPMLEGAWMTNFSDANIMPFELGLAPGPVNRWPGDVKLGLGVDLGIAAGKQAAGLVAVQDWDGLSPRIWFVDEACSDGRTTEEEDARAILTMLDRSLGPLARQHGIHPFDLLDAIMCDRLAKGQYQTKSPSRLRRHIAEQLRRDVVMMPVFRVPEKYNGSVEDGIRLLNSAAKRQTNGKPGLIVHPRGGKFAIGCREWKGDQRDRRKDVLDTGRYPVEEICSKARTAARVGWYG